MRNLLLPVWGERDGRIHYTPGRDLRGHFIREDDIEEPCPHACCAGRKSKPRTRRHRRDTAGLYTSPSFRERRERSTPAGRAKQRERMVREDYAAYLHAHYLQAEEATNGFMVTPAGRARGITGADFFRSGRRPSIERWGSEEMKAWAGSGNAAATRRGGPGTGVLSLTAYRASTERRNG